MTEWRAVPGWVGFYEASSDGRVRSVSRTTYRHDGSVQTWAGRELKHWARADGYSLVRLSAPGRRETARVHRLVAAAFLAPDPERTHVNHKDGDRANNAIDNLEWVTPAENVHHAISRGSTYSPPKLGRETGNPAAKLSAAQVAAAAKARASGASLRHLARGLSVHPKTLAEALASLPTPPAAKADPQ